MKNSFPNFGNGNGRPVFPGMVGNGNSRSPLGCTQVTLFPYNCWVRKEKTRFGPVSGVPGPKRVLGNGQKRSKATGRNYAAGPFIHESGKLQGVKRPKFRWLRACLSRFSRGWPQKGPFGPFLGPGGSRADPKTPIWPPCENRR